MKLLEKISSSFPLIVRKTFGAAFLRFSGLSLQFLGSILVARQLGPAGFGVYGYVFTWGTLIGAMLGLGMGQLAFREVSRYRALARHRELRGYIFFWLFGVFVTGALISVLFAALEASEWFRFDVGWPLVILIAVTHAIVLGLSSFLSSFERVVQAEFLETAFRQFLFLFAILSCFVLSVELTASFVIKIGVLSGLPVIFLMGYLLQRSATEAAEDLVGPMEFRGRIWLASSLPLLFASLTNQLQTSLDTLVLGAMVEDSALGLYRAASRGAELVMIVQGLSYRVLGPFLARSLSLENREEAQAIISQGAIISFVFGLSICVILTIFADTYLGLFGEAFRDATPILWILVATQAISILCGPAGLILIIHGQERFVLFITVACLFLNFVLKFFFIPPFGALGAALATFAAVTVLRLSLFILAYRKTGFDPTIWLPIRQRFFTG